MEYTSYCGINCKTCKTYIATATNDEALKAEIAQEWGKMYGQTFTLAEIHCRGCLSDELFGKCSICDIRDCNKTMATSRCHECKKFPCDRIERLYQYQKDKNTGVELEE